MLMSWKFVLTFVQLVCLFNEAFQTDTALKCSESSSFAERLAVAGEASVVDFTGTVWSEDGFEEMNYRPCSDSSCKDLQLASIKNKPPCPVTYGSLVETNLNLPLRYSDSPDCKNYGWPPLAHANFPHFLIFHEAPSSSSPYIIVRSVPIPLTPDDWQQISKMCYFASKGSSNCSVGCVNDVSLYSETTSSSTSTTSTATTPEINHCEALKCSDIEDALSKNEEVFLALFENKTHWGSGHKSTITASKCMAYGASSCSACVKGQKQDFICSEIGGSSCADTGEGWVENVGKTFVFFSEQDSEQPQFNWQGPCSTSQWQQKLVSCNIPCQKVDFCCNFTTTSTASTKSSLGLTTNPADACGGQQACQKFELSYNQLEDFFLAEYLGKVKVSEGWNITIGKCQTNISCSKCAYDKPTVYSCLNFGGDLNCDKFSEKDVGLTFIFFVQRGHDFIAGYWWMGPCPIEQWRNQLDSCNIPCEHADFCCPAVLPPNPTNDVCGTNVCSSIKAAQLFGGINFYLGKYLGKTQTTGGWTLHIGRCKPTLSSTCSECYYDQPVDVECATMSTQDTCDRLHDDDVGKSFIFFNTSYGIVHPGWIGPCNAADWQLQLERCNISCDDVDFCDQPVCDNDCLTARFRNASDVFLGQVKGQISAGIDITVDCWLKFDPDYLASPYVTVLTNDSKAECNSTVIDVPPEGFEYIFFINKFKEPPRLYPYAAQLISEPVLVKTADTWQLAASLCGVNINFPVWGIDDGVSKFCCQEIALPSQCSAQVMVPEVEARNEISPSGYCDELKCPSQICDSNCILARIRTATDVVWGERINDGTPFLSVSVHCWLKHDGNHGLDPKIVMTETPDNTTGKCQNMVVPAVGSGIYLFFLKPDNPNSPRETEYKLIAEPIPIASYPAWRQVTSLCDFEPATLSYNDPLPFGKCVKNTDIQPCDRDVNMTTLKDLNQIPCPGASDSVMTRLVGINSTSNQLLIKAESSYKSQDELLLVNFCVINSARPDFPDLTLERSRECFSRNYNDSFGRITVAVDQGDNDQVTEVSQLLRPISDDASTAITRMCHLWRLKTTGSHGTTDCQLPDPGIHPQTGCFYDLSANEIEDELFSLKFKNEKCNELSPNSYAQRFQKASIVVHGSVTSVDYQNRRFNFRRNCLLKKGVADFPTYQDVTILIDKDRDGCFAVDEFAIEQNMTFVLFLDDTHSMVAREIAIAQNSEFQLGLFASVCGNLVYQCPASLDPRAGCYADLNVAETLAYSVPPPSSSLPPLVEPTCCYGVQTQLTQQVYKQATQIVWATVDTLMTATRPNAARGGDRLVAVSLIVHCFMKSESSPDPTRGVMINLDALTAPLHVGADYIFIMRSIENSPWPNIKFQIMAPPVPASLTVWTEFCSMCTIDVALSMFTTYDSARCGGLQSCFYIQGSCHTITGACHCRPQIDLLSPDISCIGLSNNVTKRLDSVNDGAAVIWGQVVSTQVKTLPEDDPAPQKSLSVAFPLKQQKQKLESNVIMQAICQVSGDKKPSTTTIFFKYLETDCFLNGTETSQLQPNEKYLVFLNSHVGLLTAKPILIDENGIRALGTSCSIHPPPFGNFASDEKDVDLYGDVCPAVTLPPKLCNATIYVSDIERSVSPPVPSGLQWWEVMLTVVGAVLCVVIIAVSCRFYVLSARVSSSRAPAQRSDSGYRHTGSSQTSQSARRTNARHSPLYMTDIDEDYEELAAGLDRQFYNRDEGSGGQTSGERHGLGDAHGGSGELGMMPVRRVRTASGDRYNQSESLLSGEADSRTRLIDESEQASSPVTRPKTPKTKKGKTKDSTSRKQETQQDASIASISRGVEIRTQPRQVDMLAQLASSMDDEDFGIEELSHLQQRGDRF